MAQRAGPRQGFQLAAGKRVVGLDGVAADGFGDACSPSRSEFTSWPAAFNWSTSSITKPSRIGRLHEGGSASEQERALAKLAQAHAQTASAPQLPLQEAGVAHRKAPRFPAAAISASRPAVSIEPVSISRQNPLVAACWSSNTRRGPTLSTT